MPKNTKIGLHKYNEINGMITNYYYYKKLLSNNLLKLYI